MIFTYAARIYLMVMDNGLSFQEAFMWVCRKSPRNFRDYYRQSLLTIVLQETIYI